MTLGKYGVDAIVEYTTCFRVSYLTNGVYKDVLYDEVRMKSSFNMELQKNYVVMKMVKWKLLTSLRDVSEILILKVI